MDPSIITSLSTITWVIFGAATGLAVCLGTLLAYHWFRYAMNPAMSFTALMIYAGVVFFLLSGLLAATIVIASV